MSEVDMNFIIYEDEEKFINTYEKVIDKLMGKSKVVYKIHKIKKEAKALERKAHGKTESCVSQETSESV